MSRLWKVDDAINEIDARTSIAKTGQITYPMADENETAGYGKFVAVKAAEVMINEYMTTNEFLFLTISTALSVLNGGESNPELITDLKKCKTLLDPNNDIVAGTYGKEALLTLLARPGCEGLRYVCCRYENKNSICLYPVSKDAVNESYINYFSQRDTATKNGKAFDPPPTDPVIEVKGRSSNRKKFTILTSGGENNEFVLQNFATITDK